MEVENIKKQRIEWKKKGWSIPEFRGKKQDWFAIFVELIEIINKNVAVDLNLVPELTVANNTYSWRVYAPFLKGVGLAYNKSGLLCLTNNGIEFNEMRTKRLLADSLHDKYRLFGEVLTLIEVTPKTVEEIDRELCRDYCLDWANLSNTRRRMDWLEVLELIENVGNRKWGLTEEGRKAINDWLTVSPEIIDYALMESEEVSIPIAPLEIAELLSALQKNPVLQKKRNTYNLWAPSPDKIDNLRMIVQFASEKVSRSELFEFIETQFNLKTSSVDSMMPFMKADGLIEEVGKNIYIATPAAKAWCESGNDIDFIRILHSHKRFVGEMILATENVITRNEIYTEASKYGLNSEKARWILGFLIEAGLIEETQYLHVKATRTGMEFAKELPMMSDNLENKNEDNSCEKYTEEANNKKILESEDESIYKALSISAKDPMAEGKASGVAFEENIAALFRYMGFESLRIGGAGNTDVVVRWKDAEGKIITAIVDGKSKSSGTVTHSDISDVAIETHKEKNNAEYVAIVGPGFSGDTIKNHARKKGFSLVTEKELIDIAKNSKTLGLSLDDIALLFKVPNGLSQLDELINIERRKLDIITLVVDTFKQEQETMESLSARDLFFLLRRTSISPSLEELINTFEILASGDIGVLLQDKKASASENTTYSMHNEIKSVNRLRALATSIEKGLG